MRYTWSRRGLVVFLATALVAIGSSGCGWQGLNSLPLPGTEGNGPGSFEITVEMPDVRNIQPNSRVRVADVTVGHVTRIDLRDWQALLTMRLDGDVSLPENSIARIGQTTIFGSLHIELAQPKDEPPQGKLRHGSHISASNVVAYPTVEQTLAALSLVLNGGGLSRAGEIAEALSTAVRGREPELRGLLEQLDRFAGHLRSQTGDIITASESLNRLVGKLSAQRPVLDRALEVIPNALQVLNDDRAPLVEAADQLGRFSALAADTVNRSKDSLVSELESLGPVLESLADAGPSLTGALHYLPTYPFPTDTIEKWQRGDYANLTAIIDLTLSRIDQGIFTGTRWECDLTELELQWGRTIGQYPSPCMAGGPFNSGNPLTVPYRWDQGP